MRALPLALLSAATLALSACGGEEPRSQVGAAQPASGERLVVRQTMVADLKPVAATVATKDMGEARARIGGTLVALNVDEGDYVQKGEVIGVVSDQRLKLETSAYAAQVAAAEAEAARARAQLQRVSSLYDKGYYAKAGLDQAEAAAKAAEGLADAARAQRAASAEVSAQGAILAPASGRVLRADTPEGSVVAPGQSVVTITAGEPLLRLEIPEAQAQALQVGAATPIVAEDLPGAGPVGTVAQVYPAVTAGKVVADIRVPGLKDDLVGRRVRVRVNVGQRQGFVIPRRFVATRYGVDFVRLVGQGGRATDVTVQITPAAAPDAVEVLSGLSNGDVILAQGPAR